MSLVHQRSEKSWFDRTVEKIVTRWSLEDKILDETVYTSQNSVTVKEKLTEEFGPEFVFTLDFGQVLQDGRGRGGFQK